MCEASGEIKTDFCVYYDPHTLVNAVNPSHLQIYMRSGVPPAAPATLLNKDFGGKTRLHSFLHNLFNSFACQGHAL